MKWTDVFGREAVVIFHVAVNIFISFSHLSEIVGGQNKRFRAKRSHSSCDYRPLNQHLLPEAAAFVSLLHHNSTMLEPAVLQTKQTSHTSTLQSSFLTRFQTGRNMSKAAAGGSYGAGAEAQMRLIKSHISHTEQ